MDDRLARDLIDAMERRARAELALVEHLRHVDFSTDVQLQAERDDARERARLLGVVLALKPYARACLAGTHSRARCHCGGPYPTSRPAPSRRPDARTSAS